uniref:Uncharacterized protein n=1 Tax=Panagrolaimus davidi TaxID=227884 RepID=A0A914QWT0_9BILA
MSSNQDKSDKTTTSKKMSFSLNNPNDPKPSATANKTTAALDDDDEFEEDEKDTIWEDNWEDETVGEDFSVELCAELKKLGFKAVI